jgi:hypothetical protein
MAWIGTSLPGGRVGRRIELHPMQAARHEQAEKVGEMALGGGPPHARQPRNRAGCRSRRSDRLMQLVGGFDDPPPVVLLTLRARLQTIRSSRHRRVFACMSEFES